MRDSQRRLEAIALHSITEESLFAISNMLKHNHNGLLHTVYVPYSSMPRRVEQYSLITYFP